MGRNTQRFSEGLAVRRTLYFALVLSCLSLALPEARAQTAMAPPGMPGAGFQINRYEPTAAGEWSFMVDHPWYSTLPFPADQPWYKSQRFLAAGITLNYAHDPLVFGTQSGNSFMRSGAVIEHQLLGHVDLAGSFLNRVLVTASLPITLLERGTPQYGISPSSPAVGDIRLGAMARIWGEPYASPF